MDKTWEEMAIGAMVAGLPSSDICYLKTDKMTGKAVKLQRQIVRILQEAYERGRLAAISDKAQQEGG